MNNALLRTWFTVDVRSLAVLRIGVAAVVLYDLADRSRFLLDHYSDAGVVSRADLVDLGAWYRPLSLYMLGGSPAFAGALFALTGLCALALLAGWRTRLVTICVFVLTISLHARNPFVLFGGDTVVKMILFWGIFLPWGNAFSSDARRARARGEALPLTECSPATAAAMLQVAVIYIFTAGLKSGAPWRWDGTAIYYALSLDAFPARLGPWIYGRPVLMKALTLGALVIEWAAAFLLFSPVRTRVARGFALFLLVGLHLGIALTMKVNFFPYVNIIHLAMFLPSSVWGGAPPAEGSFLGDGSAKRVFPLLLIVYLTAWNLGIPAFTRVPGRLLGLGQSWGMFAPQPRMIDGWWIFLAERSDGSRVDLRTGASTVSFAPPEDRAGLYPSTRWRKFYENLLERDSPELERFPRYLCDLHRREHPASPQVVAVEAVFMAERNLPDYRVTPARPQSLGRTECPARP